jgi:SWI/SNF-related matrix-associated actin-dependent regulator of chromatin subfamily A member 5
LFFHFHLVRLLLTWRSGWQEAARWLPSFNVVRFHGVKSERERLKKELLAMGQDKARPFPDLIVTSYEQSVPWSDLGVSEQSIY